MNAITLLKNQIDFSRSTVEGTVGDLTDELCQAPPGGKAHPIGATYAHMTISEDFIVNMIVRGSTPLMMGEWAGKTGVSEPPPAPGGDIFGWANRVKVDISQACEYAKAVYSNTDEYVATLSPEDLDREIEVPGFPNQTVGGWLSLAAVIHPSNHIGEISAMKGIQGAKGYPF
jgi:DinB superfamily